MKRITIDQILTYVEHVIAWNPSCTYDEKRLRELAPTGSLTPLEVCDLDIPIQDILWVLLRPEIIPERDLHLLACRFAEAALPVWEAVYPDDPRPRQAIETKRRWLDGNATDAELASARAAAGEAARVAEWNACVETDPGAAGRVLHAFFAARAAEWAAERPERPAAFFAADAAQSAERDELARQLQLVRDVLAAQT